MSELRFRRERCASCGKALFASYQEAMDESKRLGRFKGRVKGLQPYRGSACAGWHLAEDREHNRSKATREKASRRKDWA